MPKFTYTGQTSSGTPVSKTVDAADRYEVYELARQEGHVVESVSAESSFSVKKFVNLEKFESLISRVSEDDLVMMTKNLGSMLQAGLPLSRSLSVIERQTKNPKLKSTIKDVRERIQKGEEFHAALAQHPKAFNDLYVAMVSVGEEGGSLADTLKVLGNQVFARKLKEP